jgi:hypothetical protein
MSLHTELAPPNGKTGDAVFMARYLETLTLV